MPRRSWWRRLLGNGVCSKLREAQAKVLEKQKKKREDATHAASVDKQSKAPAAETKQENEDTSGAEKPDSMPSVKEKRKKPRRSQAEARTKRRTKTN